MLLLFLLLLIGACFLWKPWMHPVAASDLDGTACPFGETGQQAWSHADRIGRGGTSYGFNTPDQETSGTFLRHRDLEPAHVLCILDLNYVPGSATFVPTKPYRLLLTLGQAHRSVFGMLSEPTSIRPFGIVLTGKEADEFMQNGPTSEQIKKLIERN